MTPTPRRLVPALAVLALGGTLLTGPATAVTSVTTDNAAVWSVNDARRPGLDTGSIQKVSNSRLEAFGSLFLKVAGGTDPMNGQMLRGFGLTGVGGSYVSTASVRLDGVTVSRKLDVDEAGNTGIFFDTFTNTTTEPITVRASFGGSLGYGVPGSSTAGTVSATADGDSVLEAGDSWMVATSPGQVRPTGVVAGTGEFTLGDQQNDPFSTPYSPTGSGQNNPGFVHELTIEPGSTASLLHYVYVGAQAETTAAEATAALAAAPSLDPLTLDEVCTIANWSLADLPGFDAALCAGADPLKLPAAPMQATVRTSVDYDVTGKSVTDLQRDLAAGVVTSVEITQAYLDRIAAYDQTQLGLKSFIHVSKTALADAAEADAARAAGDERALLGIPMAIKDLYDVEGQPNTGGVKSLASWVPESDAWQIAKLREAGAIFLGKTNLSEFANSGSFSESGFMQTWNGLYPSKSSFGSSGGSATAVAADLAPISMGTQTGVSLYAPSTGASLSSFRGTDGLTSIEGGMPLTWGQDYGGPIGQSVSDLAQVLDATATRSTGNNPDDILTSRVDNALRPESFSAGLSTNALQGKKIGYLPGSYASTSIADDPTGADTLADIRSALEAAGAELVELTAPPSQPAAPGPINGNSGAHGWVEYIDSEPTFPLRTPAEVWQNLANLPYNVSGTSVSTRVPYDETSVSNYLARRDAYKAAIGAWMEAADVDAVAYPGFISQMGNNDASSAVLSSDRASGVLTSNVGLPTVIIPIGTTSLGYSNSLQLVGPAWSDADVLAMGYAAEQQADARVHSTVAPALEYSGPAESLVTVELAETSVSHGTAATATVQVSSSRAVSGTVTVAVDGIQVEGTLSDGVATVSLPRDLAAGEHLVVARFAGDRKVAASEAATTLKVVPAQIAVRTSTAAATVGKAASVRIDADAPGARVLLLEGAGVVGSGTLSGSGSVTIAVKGLAVGKHTLTALVTADSNHLEGTSAPFAVSVAKAAPRLTTTVKARKVKVKVSAPGVSPSGTVSIKAGDKVLAKAKVGAKAVTLKVPGKARKVSVVYSGNASLKKASTTVRLR